MNDTSLSLLERARQKSDADSWNRLVDLYTPLLKRVLLAHGVPASDVDDLLQDVFITLVDQIDTFEHSGRPGAFRCWLRGVLTNRVRRYWQRGRGRLLNASAILEGNEFDHLVAENDDLTQLWGKEHNQWLTDRLIELVEPEFQVSTWQAFWRQVMDGARAREVAEELGTSVNAVLISKSRVLRRLRQELAGLLDE